MKLLVLTSRFPYPLEKGDKLRIFHQLRELSRYHEIVLCSLAEEPIQDIDFQKVKQFCSRIFVLPLTPITVAGNIARNILRGYPLPFQVAYFFNKKIANSIQKIIAEEKPDHIYCQLARMAEYVQPAKIPKTLDYMDAFSAGAMRRAQSSSWLTKSFWKLESRLMSRYEQSLKSHFDNLTIISAQDKSILEGSSTESKIQIVPNGVDTDFFNIIHFNKKTIQKEHFDIAFIGNLGYYPNVEAAKYLVKKILPILKQHRPNIKVLIAGARPTNEVMNLGSENVVVKGWLDDIREAYASANMIVAPLFHGSGQQNKILEAMAMSVPCVTTPLVNSAILATPEKEIFIAHVTEATQQNAQVFADIISDFLNKLSNQNANNTEIATNARTFVEEKYSWVASVKLLNEIIEKTELSYQLSKP